MSASELPAECSSSPEAKVDNDGISNRFRSFMNPAVGVSVSCSLGQLQPVSLGALTPITADPTQKFFTPFANKTFDNSQTTDSDAFFSALGTGLRSSQSLRSDARAGTHASKRKVSLYAFADGAGNMRTPSSLPIPEHEALLQPDAAADTVVEPDTLPADLPCEPESADDVGCEVAGLGELLRGEASELHVVLDWAELKADIAPADGQHPTLDLHDVMPSGSDALAGAASQLDMAEGSGETESSPSKASPPELELEPEQSGPTFADQLRPSERGIDCADETTTAVSPAPVRTRGIRGHEAKTPPVSARRSRLEAQSTPGSVPKSSAKAKPRAQRPVQFGGAENPSQDVPHRLAAAAKDTPRKGTPAGGKPTPGAARRVSKAPPAASPRAGAGTATGECDNNGMGTPLFLKRVRNTAGDKSPMLSPFSTMKAPPPVAYDAGRPPVAACHALQLEAPSAADAEAGNQVSKQQSKKVARPKALSAAPAAAPHAKAADAGVKTGLVRKGAAAEPGNRAIQPKELPAPRQGSGTAGTAKATKAVAAAPPAKVLAAATRVAAVHTNKQAPAAATLPKAKGKSASGGGGAAAAAGLPDVVGPDGQAAATRMILTRKAGPEVASGTGVAACRYGRARAAVPPSAPAAAVTDPQSPEKLPPSKRHAMPVTSPSKRPRQDGFAAAAGDNPEAPPGSPAAPTGVAGASDCPGRRSPILAKGPKPSPSCTRRRKPSLPGTTSDLAAVQQTPSASARKAAASAAEARPAESPLQCTPAVPKLNFGTLGLSKSPGGTPGSVVAADMVPLLQQPVSARSPSLFAAPMSTRRVSVTPPAAVVPPLEPLTKTPRAVSQAKPPDAAPTTATTSTTPEAVRARGQGQAPEQKPAGKGVAPSGAAPGPAQQLKGRAVAATAAAAQPRTGKPVAKEATGDNVRPLTARPAFGTAGPKVQPATARNAVTSRPAGVHKPSAAGPQPGATAAVKPSATGPQPGAAAAVKPAAAATNAKLHAPAAANADKAAAAAPKAHPGPHRVSNAAARAAPTADQPRPAKPAPQEPETERLQRRQQYEALLGRPAAQSPPPPPPGTEAGTAPSVPSPVVKGATKAPAARPGRLISPIKSARGPVARGVPASVTAVPETRQPGAAGARRVGSETAREAAGGQLVKPQPVAKQQAPGVVAAPAPAVASPTAPKSVGRPASTPPRSQPDTNKAPGSDRRTRTPLSSLAPNGVRSASKPTPAPNRMPARSHRMNSTTPAGSAARGGRQPVAVRAAPPSPVDAPVPMDISPAPPRPQDLTWLVDSSPCASLAVTPGALAAAAGFDAADAFGFGGGNEDSVTCGSPGAFAFGAGPFGAAHISSSLEAGQPTPVLGATYNSGQRGGPVDAAGRPPLPASQPHGLPPMGAAEGPISTNTTRTSNRMLTPGTVFQFTKGAGGGGQVKASQGPTPTLFPQAKLRFSWDPTLATPAFGGSHPPPTAAALCPTPGFAVSGLDAFDTTGTGEATPTSHAVAAGLFRAGDHDPCCETGSMVGSPGPGGADAYLDRDLAAEVPVPVKCTSPNTPAPDSFRDMDCSERGLQSGGAAEAAGIVVFGGTGGGGMGRTGRIMEDSFDALRISSMSYWPLLRDRENVEA